jgi:hypothetical protein
MERGATVDGFKTRLRAGASDETATEIGGISTKSTQVSIKTYQGERCQFRE